ncbi:MULTISPECIES: hypothetical protein [Endozoicomonas]|uniref:hypothetical protein n=1 Tax=Endozoicomonas TaxID=305899 RepID=UPI0008262DC8|nr:MULTISPECIES: hypothetical protein [Endozoicomonas]USE36765.1 hypothetical protein MJO57_00525 [Endozoicomonas sp. SCSIO W0465]
MDAVRLDPYGIQNAADHKEALARFIESELEAIETNLKDQLDSQSACTVNGIGTINLYRFLNFLITEEFNPQQGFRLLAVHHLAYACDHNEEARLTGRDIRNYAIERGYCHG